jgi:hypothetical protein
MAPRPILLKQKQHEYHEFSKQALGGGYNFGSRQVVMAASVTTSGCSRSERTLCLVTAVGININRGGKCTNYYNYSVHGAWRHSYSQQQQLSSEWLFCAFTAVGIDIEYYMGTSYQLWE